MGNVWLARDVVAGDASHTAGTRCEVILEARWLHRAELAAKKVCPWIVTDGMDDVPSATVSTEVSPSRRARF